MSVNNTMLLYEYLERNRSNNLFIMNLSEAETQSVNDKLIAHLYKTAVEKYNYIDFGKIPDSKGDITKFEGYETVKETLDTLEQLSIKTGNSDFKELQSVKKAFAYLEKHKLEFTKAFLSNVSLIEVIYNTVVYSIVAATNLLIAIYVDYTKTPGVTLEIAVNTNKDHRDFILFKGIQEFNDACEKGSMMKLFATVKDREKFIGLIGAGLVGASAFLLSCTLIIPAIRSLIYAVYDIRMGVSEYLNQQAEFLKLNAETLKSSNAKTRLDSKKVIKNQINTANKLEKLADKVVIKFEEADKKGKKELDKRVKLSDIQPSFDNMMSDGSEGGLL